MSKRELKTECDRCGTCCLKGGPALHLEDKKLLEQKIIDRESLITIRQGEPVFSLDGKKMKIAGKEIVKLKGKNTEWTCTFYDQKTSSCSIYLHRPLECILLKCWETAELEAIAGKKLLSRFDIVSQNEPVKRYMQKHERECSLEILSQIDIKNQKSVDKNILAKLTGLVNKDLAIRSEALNHLNFTLDLELFYFGRPVFKVLSQYDLIPREMNGKIHLFQA